MYVYVYTIEINISNIHHKIFEAWKTFFSNSYLGVLRLFLRVLEVARSRRLGIAGEVSVWQIPENSVNTGRVNTAAFWSARFVFFSRNIFAQEFGRAFSLLEKRSMIDFPIRSY